MDYNLLKINLKHRFIFIFYSITIFSVLATFSVSVETFYLYLCYTFFKLGYFIISGGIEIMQLSDAIRKRIQALMKQNNIKSLNAVNKLAGISNTLYDFMTGNNDLIKLDILLHICEAFNIQLYEFFYDPLFKDVQYEKNDKDVKDL